MTTADEAQRVRSRSRPKLAAMRPDRWSLLALPAVVFLVLFFLVPLVLMSVRSVTDPADAGLSNYQKFFEQAAYVRVLTNTFWIAGLATVASLVIGYPFAYLIRSCPAAGPGCCSSPCCCPSGQACWSARSPGRCCCYTGVINRFLLDLGVISEPLTLTAPQAA